MTRALAIAALLAMSLTACGVAQYRFENSAKTQADYEHDKYECGLVVQAITSASPNRGNPMIVGPQAAQEFAECMKHRYGWERVSCQKGEPGCSLYFQ